MRITLNPVSKNAMAMPAPIVPAPMTPTDSTLGGLLAVRGIRNAARSARKRCRRARDCCDWISCKGEREEYRRRARGGGQGETYRHMLSVNRVDAFYYIYKEKTKYAK